MDILFIGLIGSWCACLRMSEVAGNGRPFGGVIGDFADSFEWDGRDEVGSSAGE